MPVNKNRTLVLYYVYFNLDMGTYWVTATCLCMYDMYASRKLIAINCVLSFFTKNATLVALLKTIELTRPC